MVHITRFGLQHEIVIRLDNGQDSVVYCVSSRDIRASI